MKAIWMMSGQRWLWTWAQPEVWRQSVQAKPPPCGDLIGKKNNIDNQQKCLRTRIESTFLFKLTFTFKVKNNVSTFIFNINLFRLLLSHKKNVPPTHLLKSIKYTDVLYSPPVPQGMTSARTLRSFDRAFLPLWRSGTAYHQSIISYFRHYLPPGHAVIQM